MKACAAIALLLAALPAWPQGIDAAAERSRIAAERRQVDARFEEEEKACRARFAVNDCTAEARARQRQALGELRRQEVTLNEMERKRKAAQKVRELDERQAPPRQQDAQVQQRERESRAADKSAKRQQEEAVRSAKPAKPPASQVQAKAPAVSPAQAAANRRNHEQRMKEAEEHRAKAAKRAAERKKKPAAPLPPPEPDRK
ncbi:MAG: hypothetical protein HY854_15655 [Burkholderiales bacterium]|nr:hypothetical protein [Burkholderiales bacterium]